MGNITYIFAFKEFTHGDYIYVLNYMQKKDSNEVAYLCIHLGSHTAKWIQKICERGMQLIPVDLNDKLYAEYNRGSLKEAFREFLGRNHVGCKFIDLEDFNNSSLITLNMPFEDLSEYVARGILDTDSVLDIGCGNKDFSNSLPGKKTTVDSFKKFQPDLLWDLNNTPLPFKDNSFDIVLMMDVIEHLYREPGRRLLDEALRITKKRLFLLTPLSWDPNISPKDSPYYENEHNLHKSLWYPMDFEDFIRVYSPPVEKYFFGYWEPK